MVDEEVMYQSVFQPPPPSLDAATALMRLFAVSPESGILHTVCALCYLGGQLDVTMVQQQGPQEISGEHEAVFQDCVWR